MNINRIIRKTLLSEVAGISFEVRKWAQIIENYVKDYIQVEKDKLKADQAKTTKPKSQDDNVWKGKSYSYEDDDWDWDYPTSSGSFNTGDEKPTEVYLGSFFTHFETEDGKVIADAYVYGSELNINADLMDDFPNLQREIQTKLFKVFLHGDGEFDVTVEGGSLRSEYDDAIKEVIEDYMVSEGEFYTSDYTFAKAIEKDGNDEDEEPNPNDYIMYSKSSAGAGYGGYDWSKYYSPQPKIDKIEIDGRQFPEAYEDFKVDKWVITPSNRIEYDHWRSGYDEEGNYVVYLNMSLGSVGGTMLVHEVKHAYDDWNRMSKGAPPIRAGWEIRNIYTPDFEKLVLGGGAKFGMLSGIIRNYYLGSKLEAPAYLENEYDGGAFGYRDTAKKLMNFKSSMLLNKEGGPAKGLQEMWTDLLIDYNIPLFRRFPNVVDFLKYTEKYFNKRGKDILRRIDKMRYVHNRPTPKPYTPPTRWSPSGQTTSYPTTTNKPYSAPGTTKAEGNPYKSKLTELDRQLDALDDKIDSMEAQWQKLYLEDKEANKVEIKRLDKLIDEMLDERNKLADVWNDLNEKSKSFGSEDLPF